ncbi:MAG: hypothetical protein II807_08220, partial [Thermoguttaceae bacterium]|nr:hypothetical protein [Thermoguttaceae bacterium]
YPRDAVQKRYVKPDEDGGSDEEPKSAKKAAAKPVKQAEETVEYSDAAKKNRIKLAIVGFNFGVMLGAFGVYFGVKHASTALVVAAAVVLGLIGGACAWKFAPAEVEDDE